MRKDRDVKPAWSDEKRRWVLAAVAAGCIVIGLVGMTRPVEVDWTESGSAFDPVKVAIDCGTVGSPADPMPARWADEMPKPSEPDLLAEWDDLCADERRTTVYASGVFIAVGATLAALTVVLLVRRR